jgi:hypothetical protein
MLARRLCARSRPLLRAFSEEAGPSSSGERKFGFQAAAPRYDPFEFNPFKFHKDKLRYIDNYTIQEAYGIHFGSKVSHRTRREMAQDNYFVLAFAFVAIFFIMRPRYESIVAQEEAFDEYFYGGQQSELRTSKKLE